ncbi:hypothetical protein NUW54_g5872 [Trametes sanguinea]|uniref:Uncharacterized protein n=1 Tax=Trametes sanguinea TaxID=158606 RepID=A0ACC1PUD3_9APHY|nr:hypothetical protein NUW54_g5872 [Trametes sanguinea]
MRTRNSSHGSYEDSEPSVSATTDWPPAPDLATSSNPNDSTSEESNSDSSSREHAPLPSLNPASDPTGSYPGPMKGSAVHPWPLPQALDRDMVAEPSLHSNDSEAPQDIVDSKAPQITSSAEPANSDRREVLGPLPNAMGIDKDASSPAIMRHARGTGQTVTVDDQTGFDVFHRVAGTSATPSLEPPVHRSLESNPSGQDASPSPASLSGGAVHARPLDPAPSPAAHLPQEKLALRHSPRSHDGLVADVPHSSSPPPHPQPTSVPTSPLPEDATSTAQGQHTLVPPSQSSNRYVGLPAAGHGAGVDRSIRSRRSGLIDPELNDIKRRVEDAVVTILGSAEPLVVEILEIAVNVGSFVPRWLTGITYQDQAIQEVAHNLAKMNRNVAEARQEVGEVLRGPIARLVAVFDRIHGVVRKQVDGPFLKRYIQRKNYQGELSECHNDLRDALAMFGYAIQVRILHQVVRSPQPAPSYAVLQTGLQSASVASTEVPGSGPTDRKDILAQLDAVTARQLTSDFARDTAYLRRLLQDASRANNDMEMLQILQVGKNEMPEAIVALQRAIGSGRDAEADPLVTSYQNMDDEDASVVASERPNRRDTSSTAAIVDSTGVLPDEVEKEFMVAGISALKRMSANVILPSWTITRFELDKGKQIGAGGWANVHEGKWNGRVVAIKELAAPTARELFQKEVSIWRSLQHSNVLPLYGASATESDPPWYLVSPYLRHGTLVSYLRNLPSLEDADVLKFVHQIAKGMTFLHHKGVLHGDLKGVNVLVNDRLQCVISDFGQSEMKLEVSRITGRSLSLGTLRWKAPELFSDEGVLSTATDVYAFAVTVVEILGKGKIPWGACDDTSVQSRVLREFLLRLSVYSHMIRIDDTFSEGERPSIDPAWQSQWLTPLIGIVDQCWQQDPTNRPHFSEVDHKVQELRAQAKHGITAPPLASGPSLPDTRDLAELRVRLQLFDHPIRSPLLLRPPNSCRRQILHMSLAQICRMLRVQIRRLLRVQIRRKLRAQVLRALRVRIYPPLQGHRESRRSHVHPQSRQAVLSVACYTACYAA